MCSGRRRVRPHGDGGAIQGAVRRAVKPDMAARREQRPAARGGARWMQVASKGGAVCVAVRGAALPFTTSSLGHSPATSTHQDYTWSIYWIRSKMLP
ncbi:unnamed protein product [Urochloa humidicola]